MARPRESGVIVENQNGIMPWRKPGELNSRNTPAAEIVWHQSAKAVAKSIMRPAAGASGGAP